MVHDIGLFEVGLGPGWVYPCSLDDLDEVLSRVGKADLAGLAKVGRMPSTQKDHWANGRYFYDRRGSEICIYSYPDGLTHSFSTRLKLQELKKRYSCELSYGMEIELFASRLQLKWSPGNLRRFMSRHVLLHEIGHHVYQMERVGRGLNPDIGSHLSEKSAEHYALRITKRLFGEETRS